MTESINYYSESLECTIKLTVTMLTAFKLGSPEDRRLSFNTRVEGGNPQLTTSEITKLYEELKDLSPEEITDLEKEVTGEKPLPETASVQMQTSQSGIISSANLARNLSETGYICPYKVSQAVGLPFTEIAANSLESKLAGDPQISYEEIALRAQEKRHSDPEETVGVTV